MLIKDGQLDINSFKEFFSKITWKKVPRVLSKKVGHYFYVGEYEDDNTVIKIAVRPTLIAQISESFKGYDRFGRKLPDGSKEQSYEFGTTIEVKLEDSVISKIDEVAVKPESNTIQKVSL